MTVNSKQNLFHAKEYSIYKAIVELSGEGFSLVDREGKFVGVNQSFCSLTGYSESELLSIDTTHLFPSEPYFELFADVLKGKLAECQVEMVRKNGEPFQAHVKTSPVHCNERIFYLGFYSDVTSQFIAEDNFKTSEERYRILFDSAPDPIVIHNGETILDVNLATLKALSLSKKDELIGQNPLNNVHPEDREKARQRLDQLKRGRGPVQPSEFRMVLPDGTLRTVLASPTLIELEEQQAFMVNYHDITELKAINAELLRSKKFAENLMETANAVVLTLNHDAQITSFNKFAEELTGYKKNEVIGKNWFELFIPGKDKKITPTLFSEVFQQMPNASRYDNIILTKSGEERSISWSNKIMLSRTGEVRGLLSIGLDITERKQAEEALKVSEAYYRHVVQDQTEYIMRYLPNGVITFVNDSYCRAFNTSPDQAVGKNILQKDLGTEEQRIVRKIEALSLENPIIVDEHISITPDGEKAWHLWIDRGLFDDRGALQEIQAVGRDITARKHMEETLQASTSKLEDALAQAQTANRVKDQFIANISHEIRTPLNSILGFSDIFNHRYHSVLSKSDEKIFDYMSSASTRLMRTVDSMLNISQLEAGSIEIFPRSIDLVSIATKVVEASRLAAEEKGLKIYLKSAFQEAKVFADEYCIHQAITNLAENAIKFTHKGSVEIGIIQQENRKVLYVADSGIGISEDYLERIYEPYTQESEGFTKNFQGVGLGMALTKRYAELNNIEIKLTSEGGEGTTFKLIFLPFEG